jgi:Zn-dependent peptidase ImmA (M78 family)
MKALKNKTAFNGQLKQMNSNTYELRKKVMEIIYECKKNGFILPRIEIRIVNEQTDACAYAYLGKNIIHVNEKYITENYSKYFTQIILHEIVHACFGIGEIKGCKLMHCSKFWENKINVYDAWKLFNKYYLSNK